MCNPVLVAGGTQALQVFGQYQQARAQNKVFGQNARSANENARLNYAQSALRFNQEREAAVGRGLAVAAERRRKVATSRVSAGEAGVGGNSVDALISNLYGQEGRSLTDINTNLTNLATQTDLNNLGIQSTAQSQRNSVAPGNFNPLLGALSIGASAGGEYVGGQARKKRVASGP